MSKIKSVLTLVFPPVKNFDLMNPHASQLEPIIVYEFEKWSCSCAGLDWAMVD